MIPAPIACGLTLCEKIIIEEGTRHLTLVSCFTKLKVERFPSPPQSFLVLAALTNGDGDGMLQIRIERADTMEEVHVNGRQVHFDDRFTEVQVSFRIRNCVFPVPGRYHLTLFVDGMPVTERRLRVVPLEA